MRLTKIGSWNCTHRTPNAETWEDPDERHPVVLERDMARPAGQRWTWRHGDLTGASRTASDAFGSALAATVPRRPRGRPATRGAVADSRIVTKVTPEERARYEGALREGETLSGVTRQLLDGWAKRRTRP